MKKHKFKIIIIYFLYVLILILGTTAFIRLTNLSMQEAFTTTAIIEFSTIITVMILKKYYERLTKLTISR